jgi:hypothetical protein
MKRTCGASGPHTAISSRSRDTITREADTGRDERGARPLPPSSRRSAPARAKFSGPPDSIRAGLLRALYGLRGLELSGGPRSWPQGNGTPASLDRFGPPSCRRSRCAPLRGLRVVGTADHETTGRGQGMTLRMVVRYIPRKCCQISRPDIPPKFCGEHGSAEMGEAAPTPRHIVSFDPKALLLRFGLGCDGGRVSSGYPDRPITRSNFSWAATPSDAMRNPTC